MCLCVMDTVSDTDTARIRIPGVSEIAIVKKKKNKIGYVSDTAGRRIGYLGPFNSAQNEQSPLNS